MLKVYKTTRGMEQAMRGGQSCAVLRELQDISWNRLEVGSEHEKGDRSSYICKHG